jgi:nitrate/nitrite transporter NarK
MTYRCRYTYNSADALIVVMASLTSVTVDRHAWFTLGILSSTLLVVFFSETMLLPAIPEIMQDFGISYGTAAWIFSSYLIVAAVMTPIAGKMSDLYGKKKVLLVLLSIYVAGIAAGGFANNISFLLASRIIEDVLARVCVDTQEKGSEKGNRSDLTTLITYGCVIEKKEIDFDKGWS